MLLTTLVEMPLERKLCVYVGTHIAIKGEIFCR